MNRIAIDIDEVLVPFLVPLAKYHQKTLPKKPFKYLYRQVFQVSEQQSRRMVRDFYKSQEFKDLLPIEGAHEKLYEMRKGVSKIYAVSGRQDVVRGLTQDWLDKYFPTIFDDLILTNSFTVDTVPKVDLCQSLALDTIIDDDMSICYDCLNIGMNVFNFVGVDTYPWCQVSDMSLRGWEDLDMSK